MELETRRPTAPATEVPMSKNGLAVKKRMARRDSRLRAKIHEDRMFIGSKVDPVLGRLLENLYIEQPQDVAVYMIEEIKSANSSQIPPRKTNKKKSKRNKKEDHHYMQQKVHPVMTEVMQQLLVKKPKDITPFLLQVLGSMASNQEPEAKPSKTRNKIASARQLDSEMAKANASSSARNKLAAAQLIDSQISQGMTVDTSIQHIETMPLQKEVPSKITLGLLGMDKAGKTSVLNVLKGKFGTEPNPSGGFSSFTMKLTEETKVTFFDLGGRPSYRKSWQNYHADVHGVVYVVDSSEQERWGESHELFQNTTSEQKVKGKPILVFANKSDAENARSADEVSSGLGLASVPNSKAWSCTTSGSELDSNIEGGLEWLIQSVITQWPILKPRVEADLEAFEQEKIAKKAAKERRVFKQLIERAFVPREDEGSDTMSEAEGFEFLATEIEVEIADLTELQKQACRLVGHQRLAMSMIGNMAIPASKKKTPKSFEEIVAYIRELRAELNLTENVEVPSKITLGLLGMDKAGKTSVLNVLKGKFGTEPNPSGGFSSFTMKLTEETKVTFFDLGGRPSYRKSWQNYHADVHGVVYVVDSSEQERWGESHELFQNTTSEQKVKGKPILVFANKSDAENARSADEVSSGLGLASVPNSKAWSCTTSGSELDSNIEGGLEWLIQSVITQWPILKPRVEADLEAFEQEKIAKKAAKERRVFKQLIERAFVPREDEGSDTMSEAEGFEFLATEIEVEIADLTELQKQACRLVGHQRLAMSMIGNMAIPASKKKTPKSFEEIVAYIRELRAELNLTENVEVPSKITLGLLGMDKAGKTSVLNVLKGKFGTEPNPSGGFSSFTMKLTEETKVTFFDLGGRPSYRKSWQNYHADVHGVVYVVDSSEQERWGESHELFQNTTSEQKVKGKPILVFANKSDAENARSADEVSSGLGLASVPNSKAWSCTTSGSELDSNIEGGLEWLIQSVITQWPILKPRVEADLEAFEQEKIAKKAAKERRVFKQLIERAFVPREDEGSDTMSEAEGFEFLATEIEVEIADLTELQKQACRLVGHQRLAMSMIGNMAIPASKKKTPKSFEEIVAYIRELRAELNLTEMEE